jgi:hypothetical protein
VQSSRRFRRWVFRTASARLEQSLKSNRKTDELNLSRRAGGWKTVRVASGAIRTTSVAETGVRDLYPSAVLSNTASWRIPRNEKARESRTTLRQVGTAAVLHRRGGARSGGRLAACGRRRMRTCCPLILPIISDFYFKFAGGGVAGAGWTGGGWGGGGGCGEGRGWGGWWGGGGGGAGLAVATAPVSSVACPGPAYVIPTKHLAYLRRKWRYGLFCVRAPDLPCVAEGWGA